MSLWDHSEWPSPSEVWSLGAEVLRPPVKSPKLDWKSLLSQWSVIQEDVNSLVHELPNLPAVCSSAIGIDASTFGLGLSVKFVGFFMLLLPYSAWSCNGRWWVSMGIGITASLVTIRLVESRMANSGRVSTKISTILQMWSASSQCDSLSISAYWASLLWVISTMNLASFTTNDASKSQHSCNWLLLKSNSQPRCAPETPLASGSDGVGILSLPWPVCPQNCLCPGQLPHYEPFPHWLHHAQTHPISLKTCILCRTAWEWCPADCCRVFQSLMTCLEAQH